MASLKLPTRSSIPRVPAFPSIDFSKLDVPQFDVPQFDMPKFTMPKVPKLPKIDTDAGVGGAVKDTGYITVGLAVLAVQKVQVRRQELRRALNDQVGSGRTQFAEVVGAVEAGIAGLDARLVKVEAKIDEAVEVLEQRLPASAGSVVGQAHDAVKVVREQVRSMVSLAD